MENLIKLELSFQELINELNIKNKLAIKSKFKIKGDCHYVAYCKCSF